MGGCNVVAILSMAGMIRLELVSEARPFQCVAHGGKKFDVWIYDFTSKHL